MPFNGFRGTKGGAVQTAYTDQPGFAMPGMLAFASDINMTDAVYVSEALGLLSGVGVVFADVVDAISLQRPNVSANLPAGAGAEVEADFAGIVVFQESMQSDENGLPGWEAGRITQVLRQVRAGGRIYVPAKAAIDHTADTVNWVLIAGTDLIYNKGDFAPAALAGNALEGTSVVLLKAQWVSSAAIGENAIIEFLG